MRTLVVGDIHGCLDELQELMRVVDLAGNERLVAVGDVVDRGPDSPGVLGFLRQRASTTVVKGNHERKHARAARGLVGLAVSQRIARRQIGEAAYPGACAWMDGLPLFVDLGIAIVVHGFFEPGVPLLEQQEKVLCGVMGGATYLRHRFDRPWYELYDGEVPLIVGHQSYSGTVEPLVHDGRVFGLDTSCCRGGALTGVLLPGFQIVSVPSARDYWAGLRELHADLLEPGPAPRQPRQRPRTWEEVERTVLSLEPDQVGWRLLESFLDMVEDQADVAVETLDRAARVQAKRDAGEAAMQRLSEVVLALHRRILEQLPGDFDQLCPREQYERYSALVEHAPLARFLHQARRGELRSEGLKRRFDTPAAMIEAAARFARSETG